MSFSQDPIRGRRFVENKSPTIIRPRGRSPFSRFSGAQSRIFQPVVYSVFKDRLPDTLPPAA
jgi:hypothetical protein